MYEVRFITILLLITSVVGFPAPQRSDLYELSVVHINDFHARFDETSIASSPCKDVDECIAGFSRLYKQIRSMLDEKPDSVLLNAGDNFQGTLYYTLGKWNITQEFLNKLPFDATVLGNHEFDDKIAGVVPFIKALNHPVVVCNIDDTLEPSIQGLYTKSTVIERNGKKIGIIGVIISTCDEIASTGNLKFYLESPSVNEEAERLVKEEGVFTNIVVSHSGYDREIAIAQNASEKISLIVGGHSHTFLYTGDNPPGPDTPEGPYPTVVESKNGKNVLVVQASAYTKYLGNITVFLDENGEVADYSGAPIFLDTYYTKDEQINEELVPWKAMVDAQGTKVIGSSVVTLDRSKSYSGECTLGNFIADSMVYSWLDDAEEGAWTYAAIAATNAGGLRTDVQVGNITYADMVTAQPFENTIDVGEMEGRYIKELLEFNTEPYSNGRVYSTLKLMQFSGIHVVMNLTRPQGDRVQSVKVRCQACKIPIYEDLDLDKTYRIIFNSFVANGGDGYTVVPENLKNRKVGRVDIDVIAEYLAHRSPVFQEEEGRITIYGQDQIVVQNLNK